MFILSLYPVFTIKLVQRAGSTSWLCVSWTSQLDVCSMLAGCLLDVCYASYPFTQSSKHRAGSSS